MQSLPHTTWSLTNLNTLLIDSCPNLKTISVVEELVNLEILICRDCELIEELPPEIKGLHRLKLLQLTGCKNLQRIGGGIISSLVELEELKMLDSFKKWEAEDREERENAGVRELETLTNLRCLEIEIEDLQKRCTFRQRLRDFTKEFLHYSATDLLESLAFSLGVSTKHWNYAWWEKLHV